MAGETVGFDSFFDYDGDGSGDDSDEFELLGSWSGDEWSALLEHSESRRLRPGDVLVEVGDVGRSLFIVESGHLEAVVGRGTRKRTLPIGAGELVGEVGFFDGLPRTARVVAITECEVHRLGEDGFEAFAARHADLARTFLIDLGRILATRLRTVESLLER